VIRYIFYPLTKKSAQKVCDAILIKVILPQLLIQPNRNIHYANKQ